MADTVEIDLLSPANFRAGQPHDQFRLLRETPGLYRHPHPDGAPFWVATRYDDVRAVGRDPERFSSQPTIMLDDPPPGSRSAADGHVMMLMADPPTHTKMRRLLSREFTPRAAAALRPRITELAGAIVDDVADRGSCDLVADIAGEMPSFVIAELLGIPLADGRRLYHCTEALHSVRSEESRAAQAAAYQEMFAYSQQVWAQKRATPGDDLSSLLIAGEIDGVPQDAIDFFLWFLLLIDAGGDTTRNLVGGGALALFEHPEQLAWLVEDLDARLPTAVEELLRWVSPVIYMRRTVTRDTELAGTALAAGDKVAVYYGAANRDPAVFADPEELRLDRAPNPHVAFGGGGPHFCLGAHLARIEIECLLREVLGRLDRLRPAGEATWPASNFIYGPKSLPVSFRAR
ncbi:MAG: cytochrome P450 [Acidimicrobiia bacterium]